jgi:Fe-S-cluster containining protein
MHCGLGCSDCCRGRLAITRVEARFLRRGLSALPEAVRKEMARRAQERTREMCPALDPQGRCQVYDHRPMICRSFGAPLRRMQAVPLVSPAVVDVCDKNFVGIPLKSLPAFDLMDQTRFDQALAEIDGEHCEREGLPREERIPIAQVLSDAGYHEESCDLLPRCSSHPSHGSSRSRSSRGSSRPPRTRTSSSSGSSGPS